MSPLLKNLLGNGSKDRELAEEMRAVLEEMRRERARFENLIENSQSASDRLSELSDPLARAESVVETMTARIGEMQERLENVAQIAERVEEIDQRSQGIAQRHEESAAHISTVFQDSQRIREVFEELSEKTDLAVSLKDRLETFLEIEKPFAILKGDADALELCHTLYRIV